MTVLGLILVLGAAGLAVWLVWDNTQDAALTLGSATFDDLTVGGVFLLGVALSAIVGLGLWLMRAGARRGRARRKEVRRLRRERDAAQKRVDETQAHDDRAAAKSDADRDRISREHDETDQAAHERLESEQAEAKAQPDRT